MACSGSASASSSASGSAGSGSRSMVPVPEAEGRGSTGAVACASARLAAQAASSSSENSAGPSSQNSARSSSPRSASASPLPCPRLGATAASPVSAQVGAEYGRLFLGLPGPRRRRRGLVPGRKLRLRIPGTGITGQRRVATGRIAPGPAGRAPRCGRAVFQRWAGAGCLSPRWGARPLPRCGAFPWRGRGTDMALTGGTSPGLAGRVCPAQGQARPYPGGPRIANRRQVPGRGEIDGLVIERGAGSGA